MPEGHFHGKGFLNDKREYINVRARGGEAPRTHEMQRLGLAREDLMARRWP